VIHGLAVLTASRDNPCRLPIEDQDIVEIQVMRIFKSWFIYRVLPLAALVFPAGVSAQDGGIEVLSGNTIFESGARISLSHLYSSRGSLFRGSDEVVNGDDLTKDERIGGSMREHRAVLGFNYGLLPELSLSLLFPYVSKESSSCCAMGVPQRSSSEGLGDAALLGKYRFFSEYWTRSAFHVSAIGGLELPTGSTDEPGATGPLPFFMQPGSGSLDAIVGLGLTLSTGRYRFDTHAIYKANNEGDGDFSEGDFFSIGGSFAYRFYHAKYPGPSANAKIALHWRHESPDEVGGGALPDTGMDELRLSAGLVYHPYPEIDLVALVEIPVYGDYRADAGSGQLALDVRTFFGFGIRF